MGCVLLRNLPIIELIQSPSPESTAWNSYNAVCGIGNVTGDGVCPSVHCQTVPMLGYPLPPPKQTKIIDKVQEGTPT
eukprot:5262143-Amphidinium_carterae.1